MLSLEDTLDVRSVQMTDMRPFEEQIAGHGIVDGKILLKHPDGRVLKPLQPPPKGGKKKNTFGCEWIICAYRNYGKTHCSRAPFNQIFQWESSDSTGSWPILEMMGTPPSKVSFLPFTGLQWMKRVTSSLFWRTWPRAWRGPLSSMWRSADRPGCQTRQRRRCRKRGASTWEPGAFNTRNKDLSQNKKSVLSSYRNKSNQVLPTISCEGLTQALFIWTFSRTLSQLELENTVYLGNPFF